MTHLPILTLALLATGCLSPVSNAILEEDLQFLEALPSADRHTIDMDEELEARVAPPAATSCGGTDLLCMSVDIARGINSAIFELLAGVDSVRGLSPTARTEDTRTWGPYELDDGVWLRLDMERDGGSYLWGFSAATASDGPWTTWYQGEHFAGESVRYGVGDFSVDYGAVGEALGLDWHGELGVEYDNRVGTELLVDYDDLRIEDMPEAISADYWYDGGDGAGDLEFRSPADIDGEGTPETLEIRTRWVRAEGGRSDAIISGGDLGEDTITLTQCWTRYGALVYQAATYDIVETVGEEADCIFTEQALVEHI